MKTFQVKSIVDSVFMVAKSLTLFLFLFAVCLASYKGFSMLKEFLSGEIFGYKIDVADLVVCWFVSGVICTWFWPIKYRAGMKPQDWMLCAVCTPLYSLAGPFALILGFPM